MGLFKFYLLRPYKFLYGFSIKHNKQNCLPTNSPPFECNHYNSFENVETYKCTKMYSITRVSGKKQYSKYLIVSRYTQDATHR